MPDDSMPLQAFQGWLPTGQAACAHLSTFLDTPCYTGLHHRHYHGQLNRKKTEKSSTSNCDPHVTLNEMVNQTQTKRKTEDQHMGVWQEGGIDFLEYR
jgi:hypothetical protein